MIGKKTRHLHWYCCREGCKEENSRQVYLLLADVKDNLNPNPGPIRTLTFFKNVAIRNTYNDVAKSQKLANIDQHNGEFCTSQIDQPSYLSVTRSIVR